MSSKLLISRQYCITYYFFNYILTNIETLISIKIYDVHLFPTKIRHWQQNFPVLDRYRPHLEFNGGTLIFNPVKSHHRIGCPSLLSWVTTMFPGIRQ